MAERELSAAATRASSPIGASADDVLARTDDGPATGAALGLVSSGRVSEDGPASELAMYEDDALAYEGNELPAAS